MNRKDFKKPDGRRLHLYSRRPISDSIEPTNPPHDPIVGGSHLRWHPLRGEWVAYASHRQNRTFLPPKDFSPLAVTKSKEFPTEMPAGDYDVAVFENLFPSLTLDHDETVVPDLAVETQAGVGICEVVVFTQDPDTSLNQMSIEEIDLVLEVLGDRTLDLSKRPEIKYVLPFENRGVEVGVTLHHPHGQIYAYDHVPMFPERMMKNQAEYFAKNGRTLLSDMIEAEEKDGRRLIVNNDHARVFVPVCARYPYETWIAPKRPVQFLHQLTSDERRSLAIALKTILMKYDRMWNKPFPYLMALFQAPTDGGKHESAHMHFQIFPPYRTKDRLKYLAGTELAAGMFVNDSVPEEKAAELKAVEVRL